MAAMRQDRGMPLPVSAQVCTLNEAANIQDCLALIQANDPEEIVVIDGGSIDKTVDIATEMGARILSPGRLGLGPSRQLGWNSTNCPYVAFIDADDRIPEGWLAQMLAEVIQGEYAALQSSLRALDSGSWLSRGWNEYFIESIRPTKYTTMVGRPAIFLTAILKEDATPLPSLDEDTHLSRRFQERGLKQGITEVVSYRHVETTLAENWQKWESYGRGYRDFVAEHPERRAAIWRHMIWTVPVARTLAPIGRGRWTQPLFGALMSSAILSGFLSPRRKSVITEHIS